MLSGGIYSILLLYHVHWWHFIVYSIGRIQFYFTVIHWLVQILCSVFVFYFMFVYVVLVLSVLFYFYSCIFFFSILFVLIWFWSIVMSWVIYPILQLCVDLFTFDKLYSILFRPLLFYGFFSSGLFSFTLFVIYVQLCFSFSILFVFVMFCCKCMSWSILRLFFFSFLFYSALQLYLYLFN